MDEEQCGVCGVKCRRILNIACRRCYKEVQNFVKDRIIFSNIRVHWVCRSCGDRDIAQWRARAKEELPRRFGRGNDLERTLSRIYDQTEKEVTFEQWRIRTFERGRFRCVRCGSRNPNRERKIQAGEGNASNATRGK